MTCISGLFRSKALEEWKEELAGTDCCWSPVATVTEALSNPQVQYRNMVMEMADPKGEYGTIKMVGSPIKLSETPARQELFPPRKGEHTAECLQSCGYTEEQIACFKEKGII